MLPSVLLLASDWTLKAERTNFAETGRYAEAVEFCERLDRHSPRAKTIRYGTSPEGRPMVALLISEDGDFSPQGMARKPLLFVQNGIHSGEIEGKDASLMLARDLLVRDRHPELRKGANWIIVPVYSADAHERFGAYNRINQNGPKEMGWRATGQNLNLNRDWIKADGGETRAQLALLNRYRPDFLFDNHTTDGSDHQYVLTLAFPWGANMPPKTAAWSRAMYETVRDRCEEAGVKTTVYFDLADRADPSRPIRLSDYSPRFSHGYWAALNRPSVLVETHVLKSYRARVEATYQLMLAAARHCVAQSRELKAMNAQADRLAAGVKEGDPIVLTSRLTDQADPLLFEGYAYDPVDSPVAGGPVARWDHSRPLSVPTTIYQTFAPGLTVEAPAAYAIPRPWADAIAAVERHPVSAFRTRREWTGRVGSWRFSDVRFAAAPFESRQQPGFTAELIEEERTLPSGSLVVPITQPRSRLVAHLMEPQGPDSLVRWGFFNAVFEPKEYGEDYAVEPMARQMLENDPKLKAEFESRLKDPKFAADPRARLAFFFERSPYFDARLNRCPVVRLTGAQLAALR